MADESQLKILRQGVAAWNDWRREDIQVDLSDANLSDANLSGANLSGAILSGAILSDANLIQTNLKGADLSRANLSGADLRTADLRGANLSAADLSRADLVVADLIEANLSEANLSDANLSHANLSGANLSWADLLGCNFDAGTFAETGLSNVDLSRCNGLELISRHGPSPIDVRTLQRSGPLPLVFLRGVGLPDALIEYLPALLNQAKAIDFYSCFISYSHTDKSFARRLYDQLQGQGIRCWLDDHQLLPGDDMHEGIDRGI